MLFLRLHPDEPPPGFRRRGRFDLCISSSVGCESGTHPGFWDYGFLAHVCVVMICGIDKCLLYVNQFNLVILGSVMRWIDLAGV